MLGFDMSFTILEFISTSEMHLVLQFVFFDTLPTLLIKLLFRNTQSDFIFPQ